MSGGKPALPKTVTEMVRANVRGSLQEHFDESMTWTASNPYGCKEILEDAKSEGNLMQAIYYSMDRSDIYARVLYKHKKGIEDFVAFLEKEPETRCA